MSYALWGLAALAGLYGLHRIALWAERRGWIYYGNKHGSSGALGSALLESLGFSEVETFIASGNVVFETMTKSTATLEARIAAGLRKALGYEVAAFVRTDAQLARIAAYEAFRQSELRGANTIIRMAAEYAPSG